MKIALANMSLELGGGAEHDVVNLSSGLKKAGHDPVVITSGGRLCEDLEKDGITIVRCPLWARTPGKLWNNAKRLEAIIEEHDIDVLNPQGVYPGVSGYLATRRLLKKGRYVPNVITIHMLQHLTWWYYKLGSLVLNRVAEHIIVESDCERLRLQKRGMNRPTTVIYNCFPEDKLDNVTESREEIRKEMGWPDDKVVLIMPARMSPEKNHETLLKVMASPKVKELPVLCYLAGDGPLLEEVKNQAKELGVEDKVQFGGFRRDLPRLYKAADIFLLCSIRESLPLSIREGMAASLPVIATEVGGISEAVADGQSGILVSPHSVDQIAGAIKKLTEDSELRSSMAKHGNRIHQDKFGYDNWIQRTVDVMSEIRENFIKKKS